MVAKSTLHILSLLHDAKDILVPHMICITRPDSQGITSDKSNTKRFLVGSVTRFCCARPTRRSHLCAAFSTPIDDRSFMRALVISISASQNNAMAVECTHRVHHGQPLDNIGLRFQGQQSEQHTSHWLCRCPLQMQKWQSQHPGRPRPIC